MNKQTHTPGPWELDIREYGFRIRMGSAVPYTGVYKPQHLIQWEPGVYYAPDYPETDAENRQYLEAYANARLIAAAPELLASLESTICYACDVPIGEDEPKDMNPCHVCAGARAAVAKARGEAM